MEGSVEREEGGGGRRKWVKGGQEGRKGGREGGKYAKLYRDKLPLQ